jgi:hypothetical protein
MGAERGGGMSSSIEAKLKDVNEATDKTCSLTYDQDVDRWYVFYLRASDAKDARCGDNQYRENIGCGRTVDQALDDALQKAGPLPLVDAKD